MKVLLARIPDEGLDVSFQEDARGFDELLADPHGELRSGEAGLVVEVGVERIAESILVRGEARASLNVTCVRCTAPQVLEVHAHVDAVLMPMSTWEGAEEEEVELREDDLDVSYFEGDEIDLGPLVREAILLEMPQYPSCGIEPKENCPSYERNVAAPAQVMEENSNDLRWEGLKAIKAAMSKNKRD
jgi:uncharacterized protein